jgi:hypothetical protein
MRKIFVVTSGTVAATVGQELLKQMAERPDSELKVLVRYIDTARLDQRFKIRDGEWFQINIDPVVMKALANNSAENPLLNGMLFDNLFPKTTGVGGGSIRYNGAGAVIINRDPLRKWLSSNMTDLAQSIDGQTNISAALIVSSVGATGSGSLKHLAEVLADAAYDANIALPIRCDIFVLQPGMEGVKDLGLANTLALFAELAATRLAEDETQIKRYQGRVIMVGWGSKMRLSSLDQLRDTAASLVRVINDPVTDFVAEYQEREADNHVLLQIDPLTELPTHLSSATAVTISLGTLKEQIIERDAAALVNNLVFGSTDTEGPSDILLGTLAKSMSGQTPEDRYGALLDYLSKSIDAGLRTKKSNIAEQIASFAPQEQEPQLRRFWQEDQGRIDKGVEDVSDRGDELVGEITSDWQRLQRDGMKTSRTLSLSGLRDEYKKLCTEIDAVLTVARRESGTTVNNGIVERKLQSMNESKRVGIFPGRNAAAQQERLGVINAAVREIQIHLTDYREQKVNHVAIRVLEDLEYESGEALRNFETVLARLERQRRSIVSWATALASRPLSLGIDHPLEIAALSGKKEGNDNKSEIDRYYDQVSIFTSRSRRRSGSAAGNAIEADQLAAFRQWLDEERLDDLLRGDIELLLRVAHDYVQERVSEEVKKHTVLDILLRDGEEILLTRLKEAADLAYPLVNFSPGFAPDLEQVWHVSACWRDDTQRGSLQKAIIEAFGQGRCSLIESRDPTEIIVFYYVDGLPISAMQDLTGRCLDAFLKRRQLWLNQSHPTSNRSGTTTNPTHTVGVPVYSGKDAEECVILYDIICKLCKATGRNFSQYQRLPELNNC